MRGFELSKEKYRLESIRKQSKLQELKEIQENLTMLEDQHEKIIKKKRK